MTAMPPIPNDWIEDEEDDGIEVPTNFEAQLDDDLDGAPTLPIIGPTTVDLPGGFGLPDGTVARKATVRELTGYDEEKLTRADVKDPVTFLTKLVLLGTESIGTHPMSPMMLNDLLLGDRDAIVLGIRRATFGDKLEFNALECPRCEAKFDVEVSIDEFEMKKLDDPVADRVFEVELIRGNKAKVRLATHGDQVAMMDESLRVADQNTALLSRCVLSIGNINVQMHVDTAEEIVKKLNMRDRAAIIKELAQRQPGPDFEGVKVVCPRCEFEDRLNIDPIGLFRL